jgi:hypothetical protein
MASFLALFNGMVVCKSPDVTYKKLDTLLPKLSEGYQEDMLFARAWAYWRNGNRIQGLEDMQGLTRPGSLSASTYYATFVAWASALDNVPLAKDVFAKATPALPPTFNPEPSIDASLAQVTYSGLREDRRPAWIALHPSAFPPAQVANLVSDFTDPVVQRAFVWNAYRTSSQPYEVLTATLPKLKPTENPKVKDLDRQLAFAAAEACIGQKVRIEGGLPDYYRGLLGSIGSTIIQGEGGAPTASELKRMVRAYPFSEPVLSWVIQLAKTKPETLQAVFEEIAHAYSIDRTHPAIRKAYIETARALNLDFFADEAEKNE